MKKLRLPDVIIIGGQRCGSTSLWDCLNQHPQFLCPPHKAIFRKELHYFNMQWQHPFENYLKINFSHVPEDKITGEGTPDYIDHPIAPFAIQKYLPNVKLIAILRNPVDRAISNYNFAKARPNHAPIDLPMLEAFKREPELIKDAWNDMVDGKITTHPIVQFMSYTRKGRYYEQLQRYEFFREKKQLLILKSEDFFKEPIKVSKQMYKYLGIDTAFTPKPVRENREKQIAFPTDETLAWLKDYFKEPNARLKKVYGISWSNTE